MVMIEGISQAWHDWIASNLRQGCTRQSMIESMVSAQFDASFASACIERVAASLNDTTVTAIPTKERALEEAITLQLVKRYGLAMPASEPMQSKQSLNALFHIVTGDDARVLKLFKGSGNLPLSRVAEHTYYEAMLVRALTERHIDTASIHPTVDGALVSTIAGLPAILFEKLSGSEVRRDDCLLENIVAALARMHAVQLEQPLTVDAGFHFDDAIMLWLPLFHRYRFDTAIGIEITSVLNRFAPLVEALNAGEQRNALYSRSPSLHCHGDVSPRNVVTDSTGKVWLFDFNHAFYGPRLADVIDGAFQFHLADFAHFDAFLNHYLQVAPLSDEELADLPDWIALEGIMLLAKAVRVLRDPDMQSQHELYRKRFHRISEILSRLNNTPESRIQTSEPYRYEASRVAAGNTIALPDVTVKVALRLSRPDVVLLDGFMSDAECDELVALSKHKLLPSTIVDPQSGDLREIDSRSSEGTYFQRGENEFIRRLEQRISALMNWPVERGEGIQVLHYRAGAEYRPHFDYFPLQDPGSATHTAAGGQRVATLVMYLNNVEEGGETFFPEIGLSVVPRRGSAVYFAYGNSLGQVDAATLHSGAPVLSGEKWIATKWVRQRQYGG